MTLLFMGAFAEFFSNPINIAIGAIFLAVGILLGVVILRYGLKPKNQVLYCRERDRRGLELNVSKEDAVCLETSSSPEMRFFKWGGAYEFIRRGRAFTRFFGKEGTAYTWVLEGFNRVATKFVKKLVDVPVLNKQGLAILDEETRQPIFTKEEQDVPVKWEDKKIELKFDTLEAVVKNRWGDEVYDQVPEEMQEKLRDNRLRVTVNLEPGIVPKDYVPLSESVIRKKAREDAASLIGRGLKGAMKKDLFERIAWAGLGGCVVFAGLTLLGVI